jgi:hypothetical protein
MSQEELRIMTGSGIGKKDPYKIREMGEDNPPVLGTSVSD